MQSILLDTQDLIVREAKYAPTLMKLQKGRVLDIPTGL